MERVEGYVLQPGEDQLGASHSRTGLGDNPIGVFAVLTAFAEFDCLPLVLGMSEFEGLLVAPHSCGFAMQMHGPADLVARRLADTVEIALPGHNEDTSSALDF